ncbi:hypothetical protein CHUAL_004859 [Chamberlinius hualienensis]
MVSATFLTFLLAFACFLSLYNVNAGLVRKNNLEKREDEEEEEPALPPGYPSKIPTDGYLVPYSSPYFQFPSNPCQLPYGGQKYVSVQQYPRFYYGCQGTQAVLYECASGKHWNDNDDDCDDDNDNLRK